MPINSTHLQYRQVLQAIKLAVLLDPTSPTGLIWHPNYVNRRVAAGSPCGNWDDRLNQYHATIARYPIYIRHALWMIANNDVIPPNYDIEFIDGNPLNCQPANLEVVNKKRIQQQAAQAAATKAISTWKAKQLTPTEFQVLEQKADLPMRLVTVTFSNRLRSKPLAVVGSVEEAVVAMTTALNIWGITPHLHPHAAHYPSNVAALALDMFNPTASGHPPALKDALINSVLAYQRSRTTPKPPDLQPHNPPLTPNPPTTPLPGLTAGDSSSAKGVVATPPIDSPLAVPEDDLPDPLDMLDMPWNRTPVTAPIPNPLAALDGVAEAFTRMPIAASIPNPAHLDPLPADDQAAWDNFFGGRV